MNNPRSSQTHCQAAQTNAQTQAWQRVYLPHRTTKTTDNKVDEIEHRTDNTSAFVRLEEPSMKALLNEPRF